jgi:hypothetical protein
VCPQTKRESSPHTTPFRGIVISFSQWVYLPPGCRSMISRVFRKGFRLHEGRSLFPLRLDQVFRCSVLEVSHVVGCGWPFSGLIRKAILTQAKTGLPSDTVQLRHTGVTTGSGVLYVIENKNLWQPDL